MKNQGMNKQALIASLDESYSSFITCIQALNDQDLCFAPAGKWTANQQLDHLCRCTKPLILATTLPHFILKITFGKSNRLSMSYDELIQLYLTKLSKGYKATGSYIPPPISATKRLALTHNLSTIIQSISKNLENFTEEALDKYRLPHPLLGKLTLKEMMYFTIYHAQHHEKIVKAYFH